MGIYRCVVEIHSPVLGGVGTNTFHFRTTVDGGGPTFEGQLNDATAALASLYVDMDQLYETTTTVDSDAIWTQINDPAPAQYQAEPWTLAGASAGGNLSPLVCFVIGWRTALATRSGRGRTFLGPLDVAVNEANGTPVESFRTMVSTATAAFIASFSGGSDGAFVVWSPTDNVGRDITAAVTRNEFAYLSSRRD